MDKHKWIKRITIGLFILTLFLVVGYSFVSTNLITGGSSSILYNDTDFIVDYHGYNMNNCNELVSMNRENNTISCKTSYMNDVGDDIYFGFTFINRSYKYDAEVTVNFSVINPDTNEDVTSYFSYDYDDSDFGSSGYRVLARDTSRGYINIYYDKEFNITKKLEYIISFDIKPSGKTYESTNNNYLEGDIYKIGNEEFYIISVNGKKLTLLAKYGLNVGDHIYASDPVGIQSSNINVYINGDVMFYNGITYWDNSTKYPGSYPKYVFDDNAIPYTYVNDYQNILRNVDSSATARLVNHIDLVDMGCSYGGGCYTSPEWFYSTTYWTGLAMDSQSIYEVISIGVISEIYPQATSECVVRPVVEITLP